MVYPKKYEFKLSSGDYGNAQYVAVRAWVGKYHNDFGLVYLSKNRIEEIDREAKEKLIRRFWRYLGAM